MRPTKARAAEITEALSTAEREMLTVVFIRKKTWSPPTKGIADTAINRLIKCGVLEYTQDLISGKMVHILTRQLGRWVVNELRQRK
jgi:hypothetical protein